MVFRVMTAATLTNSDLNALVRRMHSGSQFVAAERLAGGISAQVLAVTWRDAAGAEHRCVVRQYGAADLAANPRVARDEYELLRLLSVRGLPVPEPLYYDEAPPGAGAPVLVQAYVEGAVHPSLPGSAVAGQMAEVLGRIHRVASEDVAFLPPPDPAFLAGAYSTADDRALDALRHAPPANPPALLHGDYWPGNVLWRGGALVAVIDWEDAAVGDPLADVANARLELLWAYDQEVAEAFTAAYTGLSGVRMDALPFWDLRVALRALHRMTGWGLEPHALATMRSRTASFMRQALARLPG
jgi:aminoglycoside phosphotransferase (APT) family kinase protein